MRHGTCFHRRLSAHHAGAAPHSAVAELGVVRRSLPAVPRMTPAMAHSEINITSDSSDLVSVAFPSLHLLSFGHADTLPEMDCVSPLCASHSWSSARRLRAHSVRGRVCLPDGFPPAPQPHFAALPPLHPHGPPHAAGHCSAPAFMRRFALARRGCRKSERTPNHALQPTGMAELGVVRRSLPAVP